MPVAKANGQTIPIKPSHKYVDHFASEKIITQNYLEILISAHAEAKLS